MPKFFREDRIERQERPSRQLRERNDECDGKDERNICEYHVAMPALQRSRFERFHFRRSVTELLPSPDESFHHQDGDDENHERARKLQRRRRILHPEPCAKNSGTERLDPEVFHDAIVVEHFHQDETDTADDGDSGNRNDDGEEDVPRAATENPRVLNHRG